MVLKADYQKNLKIKYIENTWSVLAMLKNLKYTKNGIFLRKSIRTQEQLHVFEFNNINIYICVCVCVCVRGVPHFVNKILSPLFLRDMRWPSWVSS